VSFFNIEANAGHIHRAAGPYKLSFFIRTVREDGSYIFIRTVREAGPYTFIRTVREAGPYIFIRTVQEAGPYNCAAGWSGFYFRLDLAYSEGLVPVYSLNILEK